MRTARIKIAAQEATAVYHCMTRTVNGERVIDDPAKEVLRKQLWLTAEFCGVEILTYAILSNHFHVLVRVPQKTVPPDAELLRRYRLLHPKPTKYQAERLEVIEGQLAAGGPEGEAWRQRQLALMGDVSAFMKLLKQRFAIWFNKAHQRYGTLFAERFKSVLVENQTRAPHPRRHDRSSLLREGPPPAGATPALRRPAVPRALLHRRRRARLRGLRGRATGRLPPPPRHPPTHRPAPARAHRRLGRHRRPPRPAPLALRVSGGRRRTMDGSNR